MKPRKLKMIAIIFYFHDFVLPFLQFHIFLLMLSVTPLRSTSTKILENVIIFRKESTEVRFVTTGVSFGLNSNFQREIFIANK